MADIKVSQMGEVLVASDNDLLNLVSFDEQNQTYVSGKVKASTMKDYMIGDTDISGLGDGTPTGAIDALDGKIDDNYDEWKEQWKKNGAYNLCPNTWTTQATGGLTFTTRSDKSIGVSNGSPSENIYVTPIPSYAPVHLHVGRYKMVAFPDTGITGLKTFYFVNVTTSTVHRITDNNGIFDVTDASHEWYCAYGFDTTTVFNNAILYPMITTDLNATWADYVEYAKTNGELTEFGKCMFTVSGTTGAVNTEIQIPFPSGYSATDFVVLGYTIRNSNSMWYSNYGATVFTDSADGVRVTPTQNGFNNQPVKVLIALV